MSFERDKYYSLTEILQVFNISRSKLQLLLNQYSPACIENRITYGSYYSITAKYYLKSDIELIVENLYKIPNHKK
ncbi:hypothetical protein BDD43_2816 [Mucilaginibacter gracilis]|uniref:Helix-turn-helix protein n=1 Tax=Mucilaginibacter gracilis TaxID=423350 RepID=A0A495J1W9_9SPHI|nr:hypothetical protein BDD43_2816 [Mucilaginibacter gracilis]